MKKMSVFVVTALVLVLLSTATVALAKAERISLAGTEHVFLEGADRVWLANGWVQQRDVALSGTFDFGVLKGTETQLVNAKLNPVTGAGHVWGVVTYTDSATGIICSGVRDGQLTNFLITAKIVATCSDGSVIQGTLQDTLVNFPPGSPAPSDVYSDFHGELLMSD